MKFGVLGSGAVGREVAERLAEGGHEVRIGTRDPQATLARTGTDAMGTPPFAEWHARHAHVGLVTFAEAGAFGEVLFNATNGLHSVRALEAVGEGLDGKVLVDLANPLDFSKGMPPAVVHGEHGSLGREIQERFPGARVVKVLNTLNHAVMFRPGLVGRGDHTLFMCGDDAEAKAEVRSLLESYGWRDILDLGDISAARGTEMILPLWLSVFSVIGDPKFQFKVVR